jgi:hypothetical protein
MKTVNSKRTNEQTFRLRYFGFFGLLLAGGVMDPQIAAAQSVIASQVPAPPLTTEWQQDQPDEMDVFLPPGSSAANALPQILRYGPFALRPHGDYRFFYGNGIQAQLGNQQNTAVQEISPGILIDFGSHWALDYTPTLRFYSSSQFRNTVDHSIALTGGFEFGDWKFSVSHGSQFTTAPLIQTGGQTEQNVHSTGISASHAFTPQLSTDLGVSQSINLVKGFEDSYGWSTLDWLNYEFTKRFNIGLGAGGGYLIVNDNSAVRNTNNLDQTYEQINARVNWRATGKISFQINAGLEDRQFMTPGSGDSVNPIFGASIEYQPFKNTQISLSATRTVSSSDYYLAAQQTEITSVGLNLNQRVLQKFSLTLGVGYGVTDYGTATSSATANASNRSDDNISFNFRLSHPFLRRGTVSIFYQYNDNESSQAGYSFQSSQTGVEIGYTF